MRPFAFSLFVMLISGAALAESPEGFVVSAGAFFASPARYAQSDQQYLSFFGRAYAPELGVGYHFARWQPSLHFTPIGRSTGDGGKKEQVLRLHVPYFFPLGESWEIKAGAGLMAFYLHGPGGPLELENGAITQTFYVPESSRTTELFYLLAGATFSTGAWRFDGDLLFTSLLNRRRGMHFAVGVSYVL